MKTSHDLDSDIAEHETRERLLRRVQKFIDKWSTKLGVEPPGEVRIRRMKTFWASIEDRRRGGRIWINRALADASDKVLEYTVVHELIHLRTRGHSETFCKLMGEALPDWRARKSAAFDLGMKLKTNGWPRR